MSLPHTLLPVPPCPTRTRNVIKTSCKSIKSRCNAYHLEGILHYLEIPSPQKQHRFLFPYGDPYSSP